MSSSTENKPVAHENEHDGLVHLTGKEYETIAQEALDFVVRRMREQSVARGVFTAEQAAEAKVCEGCIATVMHNILLLAGHDGYYSPRTFFSLTEELHRIAVSMSPMGNVMQIIESILGKAVEKGEESLRPSKRELN